MNVRCWNACDRFSSIALATKLRRLARCTRRLPAPHEAKIDEYTQHVVVGQQGCNHSNSVLANLCAAGIAMSEFLDALDDAGVADTDTRRATSIASRTTPQQSVVVVFLVTCAWFVSRMSWRTVCATCACSVVPGFSWLKPSAMRRHRLKVKSFPMAGVRVAGCLGTVRERWPRGGTGKIVESRFHWRQSHEIGKAA